MFGGDLGLADGVTANGIVVVEVGVIGVILELSLEVVSGVCEHDGKCVARGGGMIDAKGLAFESPLECGAPCEDDELLLSIERGEHAKMPTHAIGDFCTLQANSTNDGACEGLRVLIIGAPELGVPSQRLIKLACDH